MINMGKEWTNGVTYKDLLEEADSRGSESLLYLNHMKNERIKDVLEIKDDSMDGTLFYIGSTLSMQTVLEEELDMHYIGEKLDDVLTRELGIITAAIAARFYSYPNLPAMINGEAVRDPFSEKYTGTVRRYTNKNSVIVDEMFSYIPYLVNYSMMDDMEIDQLIQVSY